MTDVRFLKIWLDELDQSQWRSPKRIGRRQHSALQKLIAHAAATVPFYADRLGALFDGHKFDWRRWRDLPILTRSEVVDHSDALTSSQVPEEHGLVTQLTTSGSSGIPLTFSRTRAVELRAQGLVQRGFLWHGSDLTAKMAYILPHYDRAQFPDGERYPYWTLATKLLGIEGELAVLNINTPIDRQIEWLKREAPKYLHTFPTNARAIARALKGQRLEGLANLYLAGESLSDEDRAECEAGFGSTIVDRYGAMETGQLALQCPQGTHYHVQSENALVEILDPEGNPCQPGSEGRVVVTPLHNYAFPLIRYRIDDVVTVGEACACGRGLPVITKILGRTRQMFRFPDGSEVWPSLGEAIWPLGPKQWQVAQVGPLDIEIRYVPADPKRRPDFDQITALICDRLQQKVRVQFRQVDELVALPGGKFHDYVNEMPAN
jgi:phenylacetate-CoA ligase